MSEKDKPTGQDMPPVPRDFQEASHSELVPFRSTKINLLKSPIFYFVVLTGLMSLAMFNYMGQIMQLNQASLAVFQSLVWVVTGYLLLVVLLVMYIYSKSERPFWGYLINSAFVCALLMTPISTPYFTLFRKILPGGEDMMNKSLGEHFVGMFFGAGLMEELMKVTLVLFGAYIVVQAQDWRARIPQKLYDLIAIRSPLDGLLMGLFGGAGFIFIETGGQYVAQAFQGAVQQGYSGEGGLLAALILLLPRTISGMVGHMAWAGITGYFIGLAVIRPGNALKMVGIAWVGTSALHAAWNSQTFVPELAYLAVIAGGVFVVSCLLKARQLEMSLGRTVESYGSIVVQPGDRVPPTPPAAAAATTPAAAAGASPAQPAAPAVASSAGGMVLQFATGGVAVRMGEPLDLSTYAPGVQAEVTQHPTRKEVLGLKNTAAAEWTVTLRDGSRQAVGQGRNIRLAVGVRIDFGGGLVAEVVSR